MRVAGPCRVAVSACSAPDRQDAGLRWRYRRRVGATEPIQEPVSVRDRRQCAAWKLTHPGGAWSRRRAVVSDARHCSACGGRDVVRRACAERVGGDSWEATVRWLRRATACRLPDRSGTSVTTAGRGRLRLASVAPVPSRRLDALQFGKIKPADRSQIAA